jgi:tetratricopeptide (TPR) repeat protein
MNTRTTFLLAALAFAACDENVAPKPVAKIPKTVPIVVSMPKLVDAGQLTQAEPTSDLTKDTLALEHDQPRVDHLERARQLKNEGDYGASLTEARRALYGDSDNEEVLDFVARMAARTGQHAMSAEAYGRIANLKPDDAVPLIAQTRALISAKDFNAAMVTGRDAVKRDHQNVEAWQALGRAHLSAGDLDSAIVAFEKAVEIAPNHGYALNNLGLAYLRANENDAAIQVLERAVTQLPNTAYVHNNLGVAYERDGRKIEAKEEYSKAISLSPKYVKARVNSDRVAKFSPEVMGEEGEVPPDEARAVPENTTP